MSTQPLALQLADVFEIEGDYRTAAELRRLHEENETLRAKLSEPEPEPVAWMRLDKGHLDFHNHPHYIPLYTAPPQRKECQRCGEVNPADIHTCTPQREWVGLTDDDKKQIKKEANYHWEMTAGEYADRVQQLTEAKLKEKNNG